MAGDTQYNNDNDDLRKSLLGRDELPLGVVGREELPLDERNIVSM